MKAITLTLALLAVCLSTVSAQSATCNNCSSDAYCGCDVCDGTDYGCRCNSGYNGNGTYCVAACNNCSGDAYCGCDVCDGTDYGCRCNSGFTGNGTYCADGCNGQCVDYASCNEYMGNFSCQCDYGFTGDGYMQCDAACNNCSSDAYCACDVCDGTDYGCRCNSGFTGNGTYCADGCNGQCVDYASCIGYMGNFSCQCDYGFTGDGASNCYDIDECDMYDYCDRLGDYGYCNNTMGSYECVCQPGYFLSSYSNFCLPDDAEIPFRFPPRVIEDREGCYPEDSYEARNIVSNDAREIVRSYEERDGGSSMGSPMGPP